MPKFLFEAAYTVEGVQHSVEYEPPTEWQEARHF